MEFLRRNINKQLRNGDIISSSISSSYIGGSNSSGGVVSGNYLPATMNDENIYIVPHYVTFQETITTTDTDGNETETIRNLLEITSDGLIVNGNIIASGDVSAFGSGSTSGSASGSTIDIEDNLTSNRTDAALSANQGRIIKNLIDNIDVDVDLSDYYTKEQIDDKLSNVDIDLSDYLKTTTFNTHTADTTVHITSAERTNWDKVYEDWNDVFTIDSNGNLKVKVNLIGEKDVSAYGSGSTSDSGIGVIDIVDNLTSTATTAALSANQGRILKGLIDNIDLDAVDVDLSNYYTKEEVNNSFAETNHSHPYATTTNFNSHTANTTVHITAAERTAWNKVSSHTHNYASTVKVGTTSYNVSANTISLPAYPSLSGLGGVANSTFNSHTANTTAHITAAERTNWNAAYTNNHTHSNKSVLDGITSTKVANWDKVYEDWNDVFTIDSNGNLKVKVNLIGEKDVSAYGSGSTSDSGIGVIDIVDNLTSTATTAALSANQGRIIKNLIDNIDVDIDLSDYSKTGHTHNEYASSSHTHPISAITSLQSSLDAKSGTGHSHSNYSLTSHSHSNYSLTSHTHSYAAASHTHPISAITSLQTTLDAKSGTGHSHSNYSLTSHTHSAYYDSTLSRTANTVLAAPNGKAGGATFRSLVAADIPTLAISKITNLQSSLDAKSGTGHSHSNYSVTSHTHNYAGSSSAGGAATSANKVNNTLTFSGGTFSANSFNGSAAKTVYIPTHTSHITNNSGYITTAATVTNADKLDGYHGSSSNSGNTYVLRNSDGSINVGGINASGDTNIVGNLCVTGEITAYSDGGNATPFIYNVTSYSSINSTATNQVPTANVAYLIKQELEDTKTRLTAAETKLNKIKTYLNSLTSSSTLANVLTALINIKNNI